MMQPHVVRRRSVLKLLGAGLCLGATAVTGNYAAEKETWTMAALFERSGVFEMPATEERLGPDEAGRDLKLSGPGRANFTLFDNVADVLSPGEDTLQFRMKGKTATLGWGNYGGLQPVEDRILLWQRFKMQFQARQSREVDTAFRVRLWHEGQRERSERRHKRWYERTDEDTQTLKGTEWQTFTIDVNLRLPRRDGFEIALSGLPGNVITLRDFRITRTVKKGHFRKVITLPEGRIWRAVVEVGNGGALAVNGKDVGGPATGGYGSRSMSIARRLETGGRNCITLYGKRYGGYDPYICMQGSITMESGRRFVLDTDKTWLWSAEADTGWQGLDFDDSQWSRVEDDNRISVGSGKQWQYKGGTAQPVHDGRLLLINPHEGQFYYASGNKVLVDAYCPPGLANRKPEVHWQLERYVDGSVSTTGRGTQTEWETGAGGLRCRLEWDSLEAGVYLLHASLHASNGENLDRHVPEPLVVTRRVPMEAVAGDSYTQGMDMTLEQNLDLTDPEDGQWIESTGEEGKVAEPNKDPDSGVEQADIVTTNGFTYRRTRPRNSAMISYAVRFEHPGDWYILELDYPNDKRRRMGVACCPARWQLTPRIGFAKACTAVVSGGRYPVTGDMETLRWPYRPDPGLHALTIVNQDPGNTPAAAAAFRMYRVRGTLPALSVPEEHTRRNGHIIENYHDRPYRPFGIRADTPEFPSKREWKQWIRDSRDPQPFMNLCRRLFDYVESCERYAEYNRFVGNNVLMLGCVKYSPHFSIGYAPDWPFRCSRVKGSVTDVLAHVFRDNHIDFYALVEFVFTPELLNEAASRGKRPAKGFWDTMYLVGADGKEYKEWDGRYGLNFNHPDVRREMLHVADVLAEKYGRLENFRGILWSPYFGSDWLPTYRGRLQHGGLQVPRQWTALGYGDVTIRAFEQDSGDKLPFPLDDPDRFRKRRDYLMSAAMRDAWLSWRARRMEGFFDQLADRLHRHREDLQAVCNLYMAPKHDEERRLSGLSYAAYMFRNGWDGSLFARNKNVSLVHVMHGKLNDIWRESPGWDMSLDAARYDFFRQPDVRPVHVKTAWSEVDQAFWALPYRPGWPRPNQASLIVRPNEPNFREVFIRGLAAADANLYCYGFADINLMRGNEQQLREFNRLIRSLPAARFEKVGDTGLDTTIALRSLRTDEAFWFYAVNPAYWPVNGNVYLEHAETVEDAVSGRIVAQATGGQVSVPLSLMPFGACAFKVKSSRAVMARWEAEVETGPGTEHLRGLLARTRRLLDRPETTILPAGDKAFMMETLSAAEQDVERQEYTRALYRTSNDRFWVLATRQLPKVVAFASASAKQRSPQTTTERRTAISAHVREAPRLDAQLDDMIWKEAKEYSGFISADEMPGLTQTSFRVADNGNTLYLAFRCQDREPSNIKADAKEERDVFKDDCVALFIQPDTEKPVYYQMAFNAGGVKFDQKVVGGDPDYDFEPPWRVSTAVTKDGWVAEVEVPAAALEGDIADGKTWGFNAHRVTRGGQVPHASWSYTPGTWHNPGRFGRLEF